MFYTYTHPNALLPRAALALCASLFLGQAEAGYIQENLVSDLPGLAKTTDPNLVNPWGIAYSPTGPFWISDNGTGVSTLYNGSGQATPLVVTIPGGKPTGVAFNGGNANFLITGSPARFLFASENGTVSGWNNSQATNAATVIDNSGAGANYKGLAIDPAQNALFVANFGGSGGLEKYGATFNALGSFTDPTLPAGYAPFNVQNIGGILYVAFAKQDGSGDDLAGPGNGYVDTFDPATNTFTRLISNGPLNSPWGMALAPADFGQFGNALLVGNFGDGLINAFDPVTGNFLGALTDNAGNAIMIDGLWGLAFGNGGGGGAANKLYFAAGIAGPDNLEDHGLFGSLTAVPEPGSLALICLGLPGLVTGTRQARSISTKPAS